jgi:hypothetical protein
MACQQEGDRIIRRGITLWVIVSHGKSVYDRKAYAQPWTSRPGVDKLQK